MENWNLFYPIKIAKRYNNKKRSYLLVNMIQGKHIPVRPKKAVEMFTALGNMIRFKYPKAELVIGFAETATAIGFGVALAMGGHCTYMTTTREETVNDEEYIIFSEEHSHASEQKMCINGFDELLENTEEVILIDDEISTGKTMLNIIRELRKSFPSLENHKIIIGSILNRITPECKRQFNQENIFFVSIYEFSCEDSALQKDGSGLNAPSEAYFYSYGLIPKYSTMNFMNMRKSVKAADFEKNCGVLADDIIEKVDFSRYDNVLVLGTEESMYPSIYAAMKIEQKYNIRAYCHSTTRSPVCVGSEGDYPFRNGYMIPSFYDEERINYIYNLKNYDATVVISDAISPSDIALSALDSLLASYKISNRYYFFGG